MANINKIRLSGTTYNIEDAALKGDIYINSSNRNSIQSVIKEGVYSLSSDDVYSISGTKTNATDRIRGLIIVDNTSYNFTGSTSSDVEGVSALAGIVTFDLSTNFSISLVNRDTNHINELFIEAFTSSGDESPLLDITITHNPSIGVNKIDYVATLYTEFVHEKYALAEDLNGKQDTLVSGTNIKTINNQSILGSGNITISGSGSGASVVEVTQAQYDALVSGGTLDLTTLYIITDATEIDISNYWTSAQTQSAITSATSGKVDTTAITSSVTSASTDAQIPTAKAVYDAVGQGGGGGGKAVSGGTNISITTGETADTINCTLPLTVQTQSQNYDNLLLYNSSSNTFANNKTSKNIIFGSFNSIGSSFDPSYNNIIIGNSNTINQGYGGSEPSFNFFVGDYNNIGKNYAENASHTAVFGTYLTPKNSYEYAFGKYNNSVTISTSFGDSGNTLFSVGNGTADNARHNAFEIRQNGDIYFNDGTNDVKLQDKFSSIETTIGDINTILQSI